MLESSLSVSPYLHSAAAWPTARPWCEPSEHPVFLCSCPAITKTPPAACCVCVCVGWPAHLFPALAASLVGWWGLGPGPWDFPCSQQTGCPSWFTEIHFTSSAKLAGPYLSRAANIWYATVWQVLDQNVKCCLYSSSSAELSANCFGVLAAHLPEIIRKTDPHRLSIIFMEMVVMTFMGGSFSCWLLLASFWMAPGPTNPQPHCGLQISHSKASETQTGWVSLCPFVSYPLRYQTESNSVPFIYVST